MKNNAEPEVQIATKCLTVVLSLKVLLYNFITAWEVVERVNNRSSQIYQQSSYKPYEISTKVLWCYLNFLT